MKVGDHVELINDDWNYYRLNGYRWVPDDMKYPIKGEVYTIREIGSHLTERGHGLLLEEIYNQYHPRTGKELCFDVRRFRKLELPPDLLELLNEVATL